MENQEEIIPKLAQEISKRGEIPEEYILKDESPEAIVAPDLWRNKLLLDFIHLSSFSKSELEKLMSALSQWGCFQVINHGIESSFLEEMIDVCKQFFALPLEEKLKYSGPIEGYGNGTPYAYGDKNTASWNDRLTLRLYPEDNRNLHLWPKNPKKFREMLDEYCRKILPLQEVIYKAMAKSLNLDEQSFFINNTMGSGKKGRILGRVTLYPSCSSPKRVLGVIPHSDATIISFILPEKGVESLQFEKNNLWYTVPVIPGALFVNIGDIGEALTNGLFKSAVHKVVTNSLKDRVSVSAFCNPELDEEIAPICKLITTHKPQLYKKFSMNEYEQNYFKSLELGYSRNLDSFRL